MAGRFPVMLAALLAALALCIGGAAVFFVPLLAEQRLKNVLQPLGFEKTSVAATEIGLSRIVFRTIALDPDSLSTVGSIIATYSPLELIFHGRLKTVEVADLTLTADYSAGSPPSLAGWSGSFSGQDGSDWDADLPFESLTLRNATFDIATDAGGIGMGADAILTREESGRLIFTANVKAAQYQATFSLSLKGSLDPAGAWTLAAEIADGKIALDTLKVSRISGWIDVKSGQNGAPSSLTGQFAAGMVAAGLLRLQELTATLSGAPQAPQIAIDGKAAGVPGLALRAEIRDGAMEASIAARNPGDLADYLRLAGEASGRSLPPSLIPARFTGLSLRLARAPGKAQDPQTNRFTLVLADPEKTLSIRSDLLWNRPDRALSGTVETNDLPAALVTRLFPMLVPEGWSAQKGTISAQGQFHAATNQDSLEISGPIKILMKKIDLEHPDGMALEALTGTVVLDTLLPLATKGLQTIAIARARIGLPLESVQGQFRIDPDGSKTAQDVSARFAGGTIRLDPVRLRAGKPLPPIAVHIRNASLDEGLADLAAKGLQASGNVDGDLVLTRNAGGRLAVSGKLEGQPTGGTIRYTPDPAPSFLSGDDPGLETARLALRNFRYESVAVELEGPLDGDLKARIAARGTSPDAFGTRPIELNLAVEGAIAPLLRLSSGR